MKIKSIVKILAVSILINSVGISSLASTLSSDGRYETFNGDNIVINDILEEQSIDVGVDGETLVNLWDIKEVSLDNGMTASNGYVNVTTDGSTWFTPGIKNVYKMKANTEYTVVTEIIDSTFSSDKILSVNIQRNGESSSDETVRVSLANGVYKNVFTTNPDISSATCGLRTQFEVDKTGLGSCKFRMMLFEGNHLDKDITTYIDGMQSSFEDQLVTQSMVDAGVEDVKNLGKYKVEFKSVGKNLLNINKLKLGNMSSISKIDNQVLNINGTTSQDFITTTVMPISLVPNKLYTLSTNTESVAVKTVIRYTLNNKLNYVVAGKNSPVNFIPNNLWKDVVFYYQINDRGTVLNNVKVTSQIEYGGNCTLYEPYKSTTKTFYLDEPLRGLPGGLKDRIVKKDGVWYIERNLKEISIKESMNFMLYYDASIYSRHNLTAIVTYYGSEKYTRSNSISNKLPTIDLWSLNDNPIPAYYNYTDGGLDRNDLYFVIPYSESGVLSSDDDATKVQKCKKWLLDNNVKVVAERSKPIYEPLNDSLSFDTYLGITTIYSNSSVPVDMNFTIDRVANKANDAIKLAKENPTLENIEQARYWSNLMRESTLKDEYQEDINEDIAPVDLAIEKKNASVNADVYIKMKNSLSITLDTNNIIFDDFNGSEALEQQKAVNITINSSLPYKLSAYLEGEIYNKDKTSSISKSALGIKLSEDTNYKSFVNTVDPIELISNQQEGANNVHSIDFRLNAVDNHKADVYKTTIRFEAEQE